MKTLSKIAAITLSATLLTSIAAAQLYPAYKVLDDLSAEQVTRIKQLGHISPNNPDNPVYEASVERILTPAQHMRYEQLKYGQQNSTFRTADFNFNMNSH